MSEIPKIARERLAHRAAGAGSHPDADQLTAFQERALGAREREQVLEHLARCVHCREVVALSLPPEEAARVARLAPRFRWFEWPSLRWVAGVATLVVAVALVMRQFPTESPSQYKFEKFEPKNQPVAATAPAEAKQAEPARADEAKARPEAAAAAPGKTPDRKSTRLNSSHIQKSRMPSSA